MTYCLCVLEDGRLVQYQKMDYGLHGGTRLFTNQQGFRLLATILMYGFGFGTTKDSGTQNIIQTTLCVFYCFQTFPLKHYDLLEQCLPLYNILRRHVKHKSSLLTSTLNPPSLPVPENAKLFAWVGDEIVPREMAKVLEPYIEISACY